MHTKTENKLPSRASFKELTNKYAEFFDDKITKIKCNLEKICSQQQIPSLIDQSDNEASFSQFELLTEDYIVRLIKTLASKWCDIDPFLTPMLKESLCITPSDHQNSLANLSLSTSTMSVNMKEVLLLPLLKKLT